MGLSVLSVVARESTITAKTNTKPDGMSPFLTAAHQRIVYPIQTCTSLSLNRMNDR